MGLMGISKVVRYFNFCNLHPRVMNFGIRRVVQCSSSSFRTFRAHLRCSRPLTVNNRESELAKVAYNQYKQGGTYPHTIFSKIISKEIPANIIYEDDKCLAFHDVNPVAPSHVLVIPKQPIPMLSEITESDTALMGHLFLVVKQVADKIGLTEDGYRVVINNGVNGCQSVYHLHVHLIGGRQMAWPPG